MKNWLSLPAVQIAVCVTLFLLAGWYWGPIAMVWSSPLLAAAIALPLINLAAGLRHSARERTWLPVHGQHYVYKGVTVHVLEDEEHRRWVCLADVRKVVGVTAAERALALAYPGRCERFDRSGTCLRDDALVEHLAKENEPGALRFRTWVERTVMLPGRKVRGNLGIRD
ncbi:hypothetical protein ACFPOE_22195 [Caenimonas terrae]|uniref:Uncharacterized protein n=1 Tax=Caenimonas terrae TaxID=696074 RepID=A0ABW0NHZ9_9BURK